MITFLYTGLQMLRRHWYWAARAAAAAVLLTSLIPAPPRASLGDVQRVETEKPHVCVHTRLTEEVDEWKIRQSLDYVREMGAGTIVEFFPWAYLEPADDVYNWQIADRIVRHAQNQGVRIIARMGFVPAWARITEDAAATTFNTLPPEAYPLFADFLAAFASRYAGAVDHLIIWNEPNLAFEWGYQTVDPRAYTAMLRTVYPAIKAANPHSVVLAAALAPTLEPPGSPHGLDDLLYLQAMYEHGAADWFDALAIHTYGFIHSAGDAPAAERLNFRRAELLRAIMTEHDDAAAPAYITETGWNDSPRWANAVSPSLRIQHTLAALELAESWEWLEAMCLWVFRYAVPTFSYPDYFTLVSVDFERKPIYFAVQAYARGQARAEDLWLPPPGT
ncbi:MAG: cellulase family glycosylhydrolase [bacterium]|nr:cellulase family glycosylhydrolase [bacterium]